MTGAIEDLREVDDEVGSPLLSIVVATYDAESCLQRCLDSIWGQDYQPVDVVIIDGGSTDGTVPIIERNQERIAYWRSEPDRGIYDAWNKALDHVRGDWVSFLGADDRLASPNALRLMAEELTRIEPATRVAYGSQVVLDPEGGVLRRVGAPWPDISDALAVGMPLPHASTFHRRDLFDDIGRFDASYRISGDYELLLRELPRHPPRFVPDVVVVETRAGGISDDPRHEALLHIENHRAQLRHGLTSRQWWQTPHVVRSRARLWLSRNLGSDRERQVVRYYRHLLGRDQDGRPA